MGSGQLGMQGDAETGSSSLTFCPGILPVAPFSILQKMTGNSKIKSHITATMLSIVAVICDFFLGVEAKRGSAPGSQGSRPDGWDGPLSASRVCVLLML